MFEMSSSVCVALTRASTRPTGPWRSGSGVAPGGTGNSMPKLSRLKVRSVESALPPIAGSSAARASPTRALASATRSDATPTAGVVMAAVFTAPPKRSGALASRARLASGASATASRARIVGIAGARSGSGTIASTTAPLEAAQEDFEMGFEIARGVERQIHATAERMLPHRGDQERRHREVGGASRIDGAELARLDSHLDRAGERGGVPRDHLVVIPARQLGEIPSLRHHELGDSAERTVDDRLPATTQNLRHQLPRRTAMGSHQLLDHLDHGQRGLTHQLLEQRVLVGEVEVHRPLGDAGAARHVLEPRRGEPALGEHLERRVEQLGRALLLATLPARSLGTGSGVTDTAGLSGGSLSHGHLLVTISKFDDPTFSKVRQLMTER